MDGTFTFTFHSLGANGTIGANYAGNTLIGMATGEFVNQGDGVNN